MSTPLGKRQRTDSQSGPNLVPIPIAAVVEAIGGLDDNSITELLLLAVQENPGFDQKILEKRLSQETEKIQSERAKVKDFDRYSKTVWRELNITYRDASGPAQYDSSSDAVAYIEKCVEEISQSVVEYSSYGTKRSAIETLRKIGKSICLSGDELGRQVKKQFQWNFCLQDAMNHVVQSMTADEKAEMKMLNGGQFLDKLEELIDLSEDLCIFEGLEDVRCELLSSSGDELGDDGDDDQSRSADQDSDLGDSKGDSAEPFGNGANVINLVPELD